MKIYLVGGAIRDSLLGQQVKERDWVVVGSSPEEMLKKKFKQVGKDFPVFIHPETGEEYALARTERKSGHGYTGFDFDTNPNVTIEEDLSRRDITINAIAKDENGKLVDPFNGQEDIKNKKIRHVSNAFSEDPLRVLRVARFYARLQNFEVVPNTLKLIGDIIESGELEFLTAERIWMEIYKSDEYLNEFFSFLIKCNAGKILFPEIKNYNFKCFYSNNPKKLDVIAVQIYNWIDSRSDIVSFSDRLKIPNECRDLTLLLNDCFNDFVSYVPKSTDEAKKLLSLIKKLDARKKSRLESFMGCVYNTDINLFDGHKNFYESLMGNIMNYKLGDEDQSKSGKEIKKIIEEAHMNIARKHIQDFLDKHKQTNT